MVQHLCKSFLADAAEYESAEARWRQLWERIVAVSKVEAEWKVPWFVTEFADGPPMRDGNPIFTAFSPNARRGVRIIQHEPTTTQLELEYWLDTFHGDEPISELVISCALSDQAEQRARDLIQSWITTGRVDGSTTMAHRKPLMEGNPYQTRDPNIEGNAKLRNPQKETYKHLADFADQDSGEREVGIVLPVGCGKSGCITMAPFAFKARRTLVVAPSVDIAQQLHNDFDPTKPDMFYIKRQVLEGEPYPEPVEIRGTMTNRGDLDEADVVITNIHQLQGSDNRWLSSLPPDYFDLILFDEGHHSVAATWEALKKQFPIAKVVNFSATPLRADGQKMAGRVLYSFPIFRAIKEGYVKRLKALVLNPTTLKYVRRQDKREVEVNLAEVRRLGEEDADFRRSIVTSVETLNTVVDASIRELDRIRGETGDNRHKIIASALNYEHCRQIVEAYRARGRKADYVHSKEDGDANKRVIARLRNHELDVIVQVRKLGEGFDHPYLSVAAVFSIFNSLSPFVQFVGRIMRVIVQDDPQHSKNQGTVIFHAGANIARQWEDFQEYSGADQLFFDQLLPMEELNFRSGTEIVIQPREANSAEVDVRSQTQVVLQEIPLTDDEDVAKAFAILRDRGVTPDEFERAMLQPVPTTKALKRQAARSSLDIRVRNHVGKILGERGINPMSRSLDTKHLGKTNFVLLKAAIDKTINESVGRKANERHDFTAAELVQIESDFETLVEKAETEVFGGSTQDHSGEGRRG